MAITALPDAPSRAAPDTFSVKADAWVAAMALFTTEANATAAAMNLNDTTANSTTSVAIGTGAKTFTVDTGKSFEPGMSVKIASEANPSKWMHGDVTTYNTGTGELVTNILQVLSTGTYTDWVVTLSAPGSGVTAWAAKTGAHTALARENILCDTSGGAFTVTLPAAPSVGDTVRFVDAGHDFVTYNLTVGRNGKNIMGSAEDLVVSANYEYFMLVFSGDTLGWILAQ